MHNTVSIIIPTYNRRHLLQKVLPSYLSQDNLSELIIVDDGSNDGTYEYLLTNINHPLLKTIRHETNLGLPSSKNTGINAAKGDYILFGEDDVYLSKDYLSILLSCLLKESADIIAGRIIPIKRIGFSVNNNAYIGNNKNSNVFLSNLNKWIMQPDFSIMTDMHIPSPFTHAIFLTKTETCKQLYFDTIFNAFRDDVDFCARAGKNGCKIIFCQHTVCYHLYQGKGRGGLWNYNGIKHQIKCLKNNSIWINRHYDYLKSWGLKGNKLTYQMLHAANRLRMLYLFYGHFLKT